MEACCGAHYLGRVHSTLGHTVRVMSPEYVRPYVKAQKNDDRDAEAIAEAATRPTMRFVALKSEEQLDMQACRTPNKPGPNEASSCSVTHNVPTHKVCAARDGAEVSLNPVIARYCVCVRTKKHEIVWR